MIHSQFNKIFQLLSLIICILCIGSCSDRKKDNPFDPAGIQPLDIKAVGFADYVSLSWNSPNIDGYSGYNLYRSDTGENDSYDIMSTIPATQLSYHDTVIIPGKRCYYYITIIGQGVESNPSKIVSATPGSGFNWIVDGSGFEILKLSYDLQTSLLRFYTNARPQDMAVSKTQKKGLILFPYYGEIHEINLDNGDIINTIKSIPYPYAILFDEPGEQFWIADSSGALFTIPDSDPTPHLISGDVFGKPVSISMAQNAGFLYLCDKEKKTVFQIERSGEIRSVITEVNGNQLNNPVKYIHDEIYQRIWLLENVGGNSYIYTKHIDDNLYTEIELPTYVKEIEISRNNESIFLAEYNGINSSVVQLYPDGSRQIAVTGFYNPLDIEVNKYDSSLLVSDTGNGVIWHYSTEFLLIGKITNLYLPHKVILE